MQETDFLYPNDMIEQSEAASKLLQKENQDIRVCQVKCVSSFLHLFPQLSAV